ncbi:MULTISPECIES: lysophospholipid acyltransferase family protein [Acinetobacter]|uniref:Lysophospholipid acyltransferase family protein n=1 Tax=Acinetobacter variabilis TaxID=70346 RepID=A0A7T8APS8_9GAMM|nr:MULTISPECIES: lysophospholipid acyltransferase family protein [Acinetobacter]NHB64029.1 lysophospholipid acyltransferase family protein [Acinetobacter sp. GFQ9D191M]NHC00780.1 lysophospholipid acyltransferase family protein [Acinetobacter sp. GFQ9D192M]QQN87312.1 lysophospholipid acyltransferase family protein [Acinetobacter variabilis]
MTERSSKNSAYGLLKYISRQPLSVSRWIARILALIVNIFKVSKTSDVIRLNLEISLSELSTQERERITRAAIRNELMSYFEFFSIWGSSNQKNIERVHKVIGEDLLHDALAQNKGLVLIVPHFGTWEIMNAYVAQFTSMTIMYKPVKNQAADQFVRAARSREQANLVPTDESGVRQIFKALKQGGTTVILPDHTPNVGGEYIPYFGVPLATSNLSAKLIQKTKARALFLYALRNEDAGFDIHIEAIDEKIYQGDANQGTGIIINTIENLIQRHPEHYHWSYKRFRAHEDLGNIYKLDHNQALSKVNQLRTSNLAAVEPSLESVS